MVGILLQNEYCAVLLRYSSPSPALIMKIYSGNKRIFCIGTACWPMTRWYFIGEAWAEVLRQELSSQTCSNTRSSLSHQRLMSLNAITCKDPIVFAFSLCSICLNFVPAKKSMISISSTQLGTLDAWSQVESGRVSRKSCLKTIKNVVTMFTQNYEECFLAHGTYFVNSAWVM